MARRRAIAVLEPWMRPSFETPPFGLRRPTNGDAAVRVRAGDDLRRQENSRWPGPKSRTAPPTARRHSRCARNYLARLKEDGDSLVMPGVPQDEREMLVDSSLGFHFTDHYRDYPIVLIRLSRAKRATVEPLLLRHWQTLASKRAVKNSIRNCRRVGWAKTRAAPCPPCTFTTHIMVGTLRFAHPTAPS